jgi:hypothetical protein
MGNGRDNQWPAEWVAKSSAAIQTKEGSTATYRVDGRVWASEGQARVCDCVQDIGGSVMEIHSPDIKFNLWFYGGENTQIPFPEELLKKLGPFNCSIVPFN